MGIATQNPLAYRHLHLPKFNSSKDHEWLTHNQPGGTSPGSRLLFTYPPTGDLRLWLIMFDAFRRLGPLAKEVYLDRAQGST